MPLQKGRGKGDCKTSRCLCWALLLADSALFTVPFRSLREPGSRSVPFTFPTQFWEGPLHRGRCSGQAGTLRVSVTVGEATLALGVYSQGGEEMKIDKRRNN